MSLVRLPFFVGMTAVLLTAPHVVAQPWSDAGIAAIVE